ncbi:MAG TPA: sugar ABC transporter permease [Clostridiales bacterium]|jgi:putative aldouronate transport system permease protein|nr:sugar ABC transporter permease [Clostridiales bacterium]
MAGKYKETRSDRIFNGVNILILTLILIVSIYPIWFVLCASISDPVAVNTGKMLIWPKGVTFSGYVSVFKDPNVLLGYRNTVFYTVFGTLINLAVTLPAAYALSRRDFVGNKFFTVVFLITMFFSGGLIPSYIVINNLHLVNTVWVLLLVGATGMTNILLSRTFFINSIPHEMEEAAQIDGCSNLKLFFGIILPLSKPIIAVMTLFFAVGHWNQYFTAMIYINDARLKPLQLVLRDILVESEFNAKMIEQGVIDVGEIAERLRLQELIRYSLIVVATLPVMCIYPFIQKYFVKGIMIGAIKA